MLPTNLRKLLKKRNRSAKIYVGKFYISVIARLGTSRGNLHCFRAVSPNIIQCHLIGATFRKKKNFCRQYRNSQKLFLNL